LLRLLGVTFGVTVAMGEMIGPGILRTPSLVAAEVPVAAVILALWAFGILHALLQANVLAELGTMLPRAGGQFVFARRAFGDAVGMAVGWLMWCAHLVGLAASAIAFAEFLSIVWPEAAFHEKAVTVSLLLVLFAANSVGLREGRIVQIGTTLVKAALLALFVGAAFWLLPSRAASAPPHTIPIGLFALAAAYQLIRGAYNGWLAPVYFAEESVTPARNIPKSLFLGIVLTGTLYLLVNAALLYALGSSQMAGGPLPYLAILSRFGGSGMNVLFAAGAMITALSCANANVMIAPRVLFALSRENLLPASLQAVNAGGSPHVAFALTAAVAIVVAASGGFRFVFGMIGTLATLSCLVTELAYFRLRLREPERTRPWKAVLHPWLPGFAVGIDAALLVSFVFADPRGAAFAMALCLLSVPFVLAVKRRPAAL
jgi:APA family basic amino acid/polyamine antiporter